MLLDTNTLSAPQKRGNKADSSQKKKSQGFVISTVARDGNPQNGRSLRRRLIFGPGLFAPMQAQSVSTVTRRLAGDKRRRPCRVTYQKDTGITFGRKWAVALHLQRSDGALIQGDSRPAPGSNKIKFQGRGRFRQQERVDEPQDSGRRERISDGHAAVPEPSPVAEENSFHAGLCVSGDWQRRGGRDATF